MNIKAFKANLHDLLKKYGTTIEGDTHGIDTQFVVFSTNEKQETIANYSSFISASDLKK